MRDSIERLNGHLKEIQEKPESLMGVANNVGHYLPDHQIAMTQAVSGAANYLNQLRPQVPQNSPLDSSNLPASPLKTRNFHNALTIAEDPLSVLQKVKDGTIHSEDIKHLQNLYPKLHERMVQKMNDQMTEHLSKGNEIPKKLQRSLSLFLGQNLNSSITPQALLSSQSTFLPNAPQPTQQQPKQHKTPENSLKKISSLDATPLQKIGMQTKE